jgi:hypothetical protein
VVNNNRVRKKKTGLMEATWAEFSSPTSVKKENPITSIQMIIRDER